MAQDFWKLFQQYIGIVRNVFQEGGEGPFVGKLKVWD